MQAGEHSGLSLGHGRKGCLLERAGQAVGQALRRRQRRPCSHRCRALQCRTAQLLKFELLCSGYLDTIESCNRFGPVIVWSHIDSWTSVREISYKQRAPLAFDLHE